jgi:hypothetical protein
MVERGGRDVAFRNLHGNDFHVNFHDNLSHRPIWFPWSRRMAGIPDSGAGMAAHTSRRPSSDCDEGEVRLRRWAAGTGKQSRVSATHDS